MKVNDSNNNHDYNNDDNNNLYTYTTAYLMESKSHPCAAEVRSFVPLELHYSFLRGHRLLGVLRMGVIHSL